VLAVTIAAFVALRIWRADAMLLIGVCAALGVVWGAL